MLRTAPGVVLILLLFQCPAMGDWRLDSVFETAKSEAVKLSKEPRALNGIDRVRKAMNDHLSKHKFRGTVKVVVEPNREQAGIRIDATTFILVVLAERGRIIYSELVEL